MSGRRKGSEIERGEELCLSRKVVKVLEETSRKGVS